MMATPLTQAPPRRGSPKSELPAPRRGERGSDRFVSIALSVLVHALIVGALLWGWYQYRKPHPVPQTLAIEGTVVTHAPPPHSPAVTHPAPSPVPPTPAPAPPAPDQTQLAQQARERAEAQQRAAEQAAAKLQAQKQAAAKLAAQQAEQEKAQKAALQAHEAAEKAAAEKAAQLKAAQEAAAAAAAKAEARRKAEEQAAHEAKLAAERKAREEAERKAEAAALKAKQEAAREQQLLAQQMKAEQAERQRAADLQSQLQAEEKLDALEHGPAMAEYVALIAARITRAWIRPPSAQPGLKCIVRLTQIPGGEITNVQVQSCNGDEATRQSVETAAYRASPLPAPPDPALFQPNITVTFAPDQ
jgi:colicin import membrane protein